MLRRSIINANAWSVLAVWLLATLAPRDAAAQTLTTPLLTPAVTAGADAQQTPRGMGGAVQPDRGGRPDGDDEEDDNGPGDRVPPFRHIFVIVMENKEFSEVIGSANAPYLNRLAAQYGVADRSFGVTHPSLPNYLALIGGDTFGVTSNCTDCFTDRPSLVDQIEAHRKTWKAYMEDLPGPCFLGSSAGGYVLKHNPFLYFQSVRSNPARCNRVVPLTQFSADLTGRRPPDFLWVTPNLRHDTHDAPVAEGDAWLAGFVPQILNSQAWREGGLLLITWDEGRTTDGCCGVAAGGHVATVVVARQMKHAYRSPLPVTHYSLLRTIEDAWGLGHLGHSGDPGTLPLADFFRHD